MIELMIGFIILLAYGFGFLVCVAAMIWLFVTFFWLFMIIIVIATFAGLCS